MKPDSIPRTIPALVGADTTLTISAREDQLVICAPADLDLEMTEVLVRAAASAVASGSTVMIDLDPDTTSDELIAQRPLSFAGVGCINEASGPVVVMGPGYVRLATRDAYWTIDVAHGRLCRSNDIVDPAFVASAAWVRIHALWATDTSVTALAHDGTYLSALAEWTRA